MEYSFPEMVATQLRSTEVRGNRYDFEVGKPVIYDNDMMVNMVDWISDAMWEIVTSPEVSTIPYIPVYQQVGGQRNGDG